MKKLRLLMWPDCNKTCEGCCNKDWDLNVLPVVEDFSPYDIIMLTGGEPMLFPGIVMNEIDRIRSQNTHAKIYMYTADVTRTNYVRVILSMIDGITLTLHEPGDVASFLEFSALLKPDEIEGKSLRLNVFDDVNFLHPWLVRTGMSWETNCPLPEGEVFMKLNK